MLKNYVKIALRNFLKNKTYSVLNISGWQSDGELHSDPFVCPP